MVWYGSKYGYMAVFTAKGEIFKIRMHVSRRVGLKTPARRNATVKVIGRPKISETKRDQVGAQLATD